MQSSTKLFQSRQHNTKQGKSFIQYFVYLLIISWILASYYIFFYSLNSAHPSSSSSKGPTIPKIRNFQNLKSYETTTINMGPIEPLALTHEKNCPSEPRPGYPMEWPIIDVINNWNPDDVERPKKIYESICRFNYETEYENALNYRNKELPFIIYNVPKMNETIKKWNNPDYLSRKLGQKTYLTEYSKNNHFMYYSVGTKGPSGWKPPVENKLMNFNDWMKFAVANENSTADTPKYYFRVNDREASFLTKDLPMLTRDGDVDDMFIVNKKYSKGIFCRFGFGKIVAASHFDGSRNFVAIMGGLRRYMLAAPKNCENMYLYPKGHPSGRHSEIDWSDVSSFIQYPKFKQATVNEVILSAGDFMYIPSGWIHYVMSLNINWQCNTRSGKSKGGQENDLKKCGF